MDIRKTIDLDGNKFTVIIYLNKELKGTNGQFPVYIRLAYLQKSTKLKSFNIEGIYKDQSEIPIGKINLEFACIKRLVQRHNESYNNRQALILSVSREYKLFVKYKKAVSRANIETKKVNQVWKEITSLHNVLKYMVAKPC